MFSCQINSSHRLNTVVIAPYKIEDYLGTEHKRPGFDHLGFEVEDLQAFKDDVDLLAKHDPDIWRPNLRTLSPNTKSSWTCFGAAGMGSTKCATRRET